METHERVLVYFDQERITVPAEVCWECSDPDAGVWVPASFCTLALAGMPADVWEDDLLFGYTPSSAPSIWDEEPYDALDRWEIYAV